MHVIHYWFPDTAEFDGCIFDIKTPITDATEEHALLVLTLCQPFRCLDDLLGKDGKFTTKLREIGKAGFAKHHQDFLNNIQDARANFDRYPRMEDELERKTKRFRANNIRGMEDLGDEDNDDDDEDEDDDEEDDDDF